MNRFLLGALAALALVALPACDLLGGSDDGRPDAEVIVGTWDASAVNVLVDVGPTNIPIPISDLAADEQSFTFGGDGRFTFVFDPDDARRITVTYQGTTYVDVPLPDGPLNLTGDYVVQESTGEVQFSTIAGQTGDDFVMDYDFSGDRSGLELGIEDPRIFRLLFGLADEDYEVFAQYVVGGSIDYEKRL